jgi:hypothetical protein
VNNFVVLREKNETNSHNSKLGTKPASSLGHEPLGSLLFISSDHNTLPFLPTLQDVENWMLHKRKQELLGKFIS